MPTNDNISEKFSRGLKIRREVLGNDYVNKSLEEADDFSRPVQELVTEYCWGEIWAREGLDRRTRSLINVAMLTALNRPHEIRLHVAGAIRNGCSKDELREVVLQTAIYCGVPACIDTMNIVRSIQDE